MTQNFVPVTKDAHQNKKIKPIQTFAFASEIHMVSVMMHEFLNAASVFPIVFLEDTDQETFRPMALLGLEPQVNLFVDNEGAWKAPYIPAIIRRYPFALARTSNEDQRYPRKLFPQGHSSYWSCGEVLFFLVHQSKKSPSL